MGQQQRDHSDHLQSHPSAGLRICSACLAAYCVRHLLEQVATNTKRCSSNCHRLCKELPNRASSCRSPRTSSERTLPASSAAVLHKHPEATASPIEEHTESQQREIDQKTVRRCSEQSKSTEMVRLKSRTPPSSARRAHPVRRGSSENVIYQPSTWNRAA